MYNIKQGHTLSERKKLHGTLHMHDLASCIRKQMYIWTQCDTEKSRKGRLLGHEEGLDAGHGHEL